MPKSRSRLTRRGIVLLAALPLLVALVVVVVARQLGESDCTVEVGTRSVDLDQDQAERASLAVAKVVRASGSARSAAKAVTSSTGLVGPAATVVGGALSGRDRGALFCRYGGGGSESDKLNVAGLTHRAAAVRTDMAKHFGSLPLGGFAPGGVNSGHMVGSAHYEGRAIDAFFRPITKANKQDGWALAQYLVANADRLALATVIFDGQIWTARRAGQGWRPYAVSHRNRSTKTIKILEHRDHVHVDVAD
ncbi:hypothetical protein ABIE44_001979 [Marmoricola sp. OAE513]|uniref:hypothetical protein n=1 Tax=Marmoricola sp. OAE513 TaxID=2817894 RepID=UPI001AE7F196